MAPKAAAKAAAAQAAKEAMFAKARADEAAALRKATLAQEATTKRAQQSNMLTQLKNKAASNDPDAKSFLEVYNKLGRFDAQKSDMLSKWDKERFALCN